MTKKLAGLFASAPAGGAAGETASTRHLFLCGRAEQLLLELLFGSSLASGDRSLFLRFCVSVLSAEKAGRSSLALRRRLVDLLSERRGGVLGLLFPGKRTGGAEQQEAAVQEHVLLPLLFESGFAETACGGGCGGKLQRTLDALEAAAARAGDGFLAARCFVAPDAPAAAGGRNQHLAALLDRAAAALASACAESVAQVADGDVAKGNFFALLNSDVGAAPSALEQAQAQLLRLARVMPSSALLWGGLLQRAEEGAAAGAAADDLRRRTSACWLFGVAAVVRDVRVQRGGDFAESQRNELDGACARAVAMGARGELPAGVGEQFAAIIGALLR